MNRAVTFGSRLMLFAISRLLTREQATTATSARDLPFQLPVSRLIRLSEQGCQLFFFARYCYCGPGNSVGIATGYRLDGPGIESQ
jgi:hypothetical protein